MSSNAPSIGAHGYSRDSESFGFGRPSARSSVPESITRSRAHSRSGSSAADHAAASSGAGRSQAAVEGEGTPASNSASAGR